MNPAHGPWPADWPLLRRAARAACRLPDDPAVGPPPSDHFLPLLERHRMTPLAAAHLPPDLLPDPVKRRAMGLAASTSRLIETLGNVAPAFDRAGVRWLLFKGPALAVEAYGDATARPLDDLDFIVRPADAAEAARILEQLGWREQSRSAGERALRLHGNWGLEFRHAQSHGLIELKVDILPAYFGMSLRGLIPWDTPRRVRVDEHAIPVLPEELNLLALLGHGAWHRWERLLWLCDIAALFRRDNARAGAAGRTVAHGWQTVAALGVWMVREVLGSDAAVDDGAPLPAVPVSDCLNALRAVPPLPAPASREALRFHLALRERLRDRAAHWVRRALIPGDGDWRAMPLGAGRVWPYYLLRPLRLLLALTRRAARR